MGSARQKRLGASEEINLIPIMNMVAMLIPFLLMAAQFVELAVIDSTLPAIGAPIKVGEAAPDQTLALSVLVTDRGYTVAGTATVLNTASGGTQIPCLREGCLTADSYDSRELSRLLGRVKDEHPTEERLVLIPAGDIPYEVLIRTMDATREDRTVLVDGRARVLFPNVLISGGAK